MPAESQVNQQRDGIDSSDASLYLHPQTLARLGTFELRAKHIVEGVMSGMHRSPMHGFSVEFAQHRQYVPGDDLRHLDWKVWGRTDRLHLKQYQQETNLDVICLVDASGSMAYGSRSFADASGTNMGHSPDGRVLWSKFDHATAVAAAISYITLSQGDRAGLVVFSDKVHALLKRSSSQTQWRQIVSALSTEPMNIDPSRDSFDARATNIARVMEQTMATVTNRSLVVLISDLFMQPERFKAALARIKGRGHDLILFQTIDRAELTFDTEMFGAKAGRPERFLGLEGEGALRVDPRAIRDGYLKAIHGHIDMIKHTVLQFGFDYHLIDTYTWLGPTLAAFVARRNAEMRRNKQG
ncbi:MAG: DUF58 domain-containing protein [Phycisphaeraceae bacterium]|nr:DUF58 domain-containing protein [Phycisphaerales bacterium]MCB9861103.1 DUF58 domain-containing protein [Phycisphaeraceae bacterium]